MLTALKTLASRNGFSIPTEMTLSRYFLQLRTAPNRLKSKQDRMLVDLI
jgi:hypothetical protein